MRAKSSSVMVDLKGAPTPEKATELADALSHLAGVTGSRVSLRAHRVLLVDYRPQVTDARTILQVIGRRGFEGRLIGM